MKRLFVLLCLTALNVSAQEAAPTPDAADPTIRVISTPASETGESKLVKAVRGAAEARLTNEATVQITNANLAYERRGDRGATSGITKTAEGRLTFKKAETVDPMLQLNAVLATTSNVKILKSPREQATGGETVATPK